MAEKDSWGLTEEEKRERLREINQKNAKRGPTRGGRSSCQGVKLLYIRDYHYGISPLGTVNKSLLLREAHPHFLPPKCL